MMKPTDQTEHLMRVPPTCARLWTAEETSQFLGIPVSTLHQWRYFAKGPGAFRVGRHLRYDPAVVRHWLDAQITAMKPTPTDAPPMPSMPPGMPGGMPGMPPNFPRMPGPPGPGPGR